MKCRKVQKELDISGSLISNLIGNMEWYKAKHIANSQKDDIDYKETFSSVSKKESLRIIMALMAQNHLQLHQMNVQTTFLKGDLEEEVYINQPKCFSIRKHLR